MFKCSNCGKEFTTGGKVPNHSYGFKAGKPFATVLCEECSHKLTDAEKTNLEVKNANS